MLFLLSNTKNFFKECRTTMQSCDYGKIIQLVKQANNAQTFHNETFINFKNVLETKYPELFITFTQIYIPHIYIFNYYLLSKFYYH